jgi:thiol:disulfide interchange protein DsbD
VAGVLVSFLLIAVVLSVLRSAGQWIGWGFQLQSPVFLSILVWLFIALSLNLLGVFEIDFFDTGIGGGWTRLGGTAGSFFTGVLAVIVASPCTAPFMGAALGFGLSQAWPVLFGIFFLLGLGLAFPYLLFALFPAWTRFLPKPGAWMQVVKRIMALPMLATMFWLFWVLMQSSSTVVMVIVVCGGLLLALALAYGRLVHRTLTSILLVMGLGWIAFAAPSPTQVSAGDGGNWLPFSEAKLNSLKGKNVFVDMTADWCLSCKVNERLVLDQPDVLELLKAKNVILLRGDWTQRNEEITRFLSRYDRVGVPFYVLYSPKNPNGVALPEVLTKSSFIDWINSEFP